MIAIPGNVRVWLATGHTDMRRGFPSLARLVQESLKRDPHAGDLYVFRGRRGDLIKIIWHDGQGACLFTKRLERGRFLWPSLADGVVTISVAQLSYLLSGIDCMARIDADCRQPLGAQRMIKPYRQWSGLKHYAFHGWRPLADELGYDSGIRCAPAAPDPFTCSADRD